MPSEYCTRHTSLRDAAKSVLPHKTKYTAPSRKADAVHLRPWQNHWLPRVMDRAPKERVIHWVWGSPGHGKSFIKDYLNENHPHSCYTAGQKCSMDDL
eukprot:4543638-Pyramimonas_sp.AAC.1